MQSEPAGPDEHCNDTINGAQGCTEGTPAGN